MISVLLATALAQQNSELVPDGKDCQLPAAIYGTSGWANAEQALDTNATTYSAATSAERLGLDQASADRDTRGFVVWEVNQTYNAAQVPSFHGEFGNGGSRTNCDGKYRVGLRPVDLQATLLAGVFGTEHVGGFFATSQTSGQVAAADSVKRGVVNGYLYPLYSSLSLPFAVFRPVEYRSGAGGVGLDAVYGAWVDTSGVLAKVGYTSSSGLFANVRETTVGLFATAVVRPGDGSMPVLRVGMRRFDPSASAGEDAAIFGMPSVYYRDIPLAVPRGVDDSGAVHQRLRTAHLELEDLGRLLDLATTIRARPQAGVSGALAGLHGRGYHARSDDDSEEVRGWGLVQGGVVTMLEQASLGVPGGTVPSWRLEAGFRSQGAAAWLQFQFNDDEQLALYPFARNALSTQIHAEVTRW